MKKQTFQLIESEAYPKTISNDAWSLVRWDKLSLIESQ